MKKIRGLKRKRKELDKLLISLLEFDPDFLKKYSYFYQKIHVTPWSNNSTFQKLPKGFRNQIAIGLIDIYNSWKEKLDKLNEPYYLKIWLYYPRIFNSQVVCAVGDKIEHYENLFPLTEENKVLPTNHVKNAEQKLNTLEWQSFLDQEIIFESFYSRDLYNNEIEYLEDQKEIIKIRNKHDKKVFYENDIAYFLTKGIIWINN